MLHCANGWTFHKGTPIADQIRCTADAGFDGLELTFDEAGELSTQTDASTCGQFGAQMRELGLKPVGLITGLFWRYHFGHPDAAIREKATDVTLRGMDRANWIGADMLLIVPASLGRWSSPKPCGSYQDALNRTFDALVELVPEAESRGVMLGVENIWNRFLLSPVEFRDLIDRVNSPWVVAYFDVGNALRFGYPEDWIRTLDTRIQRIHLKDYDLRKDGLDGFCPLGDGDVNWPAVTGALHDIGYDGPVTYEGPGELADIRRRIATVLGGR